MIKLAPLAVALAVLAFIAAKLYYREALSRKDELNKDLKEKLALRPISEEDVRKRIEAVEDESRKKIDTLKDTLKAEYQSKIEALNAEHQSKTTLLRVRNKQQIEICERALDKLQKKYDALKKQLDDKSDKT